MAATNHTFKAIFVPIKGDPFEIDVIDWCRHDKEHEAQVSQLLSVALGKKVNNGIHEVYTRAEDGTLWSITEAYNVPDLPTNEVASTFYRGRPINGPVIISEDVYSEEVEDIVPKNLTLESFNAILKPALKTNEEKEKQQKHRCE
jgi:hypothetical protein